MVFCSWKRSRIQEIYWKKKQRIINQVYTVLRKIFFSWYFHMIFFFFFTFAICTFTIVHLFYSSTPAFLSIIPTGYNRSSKDKSRAISHTKSVRGSGSLLCRGSRWVSRPDKYSVFSHLPTLRAVSLLLENLWASNCKFTQQESRKTRTVKRSRVTNVIGLLLTCFDVIFT